MIHLKYIFVIFANVMEQLRDKYERFKVWQIKPHEVGKLSAEKHVCATCGTEFHGNYCPRCGQRATIGRYSFKSAFLLFLDVWGLGNRGMFRAIRDLLFRPGYMIRDYLSGMQMAYFPPFKMFFLLIALSVLVDSGFNIKMQNNIKRQKEDIVKTFDKNNNTDSIVSAQKMTAQNIIRKDTINLKGKQITIEKTGDNAVKLDGQDINLKILDNIKGISKWMLDNQTLLQLIWLILLSGPLYLFFVHNPRIPDIRYSEFFVAMVYITNMMTIISIICNFFFPGHAIFDILIAILTLVPLHQLSGFSYKRTFLNVVGAFVVLIIGLIAISVILGLLTYFIIEHVI